MTGNGAAHRRPGKADNSCIQHQGLLFAPNVATELRSSRLLAKEALHWKITPFALIAEVVTAYGVERGRTIDETLKTIKSVRC